MHLRKIPNTEPENLPRIYDRLAWAERLFRVGTMAVQLAKVESEFKCYLVLRNLPGASWKLHASQDTIPLALSAADELQASIAHNRPAFERLAEFGDQAESFGILKKFGNDYRPFTTDCASACGIYFSSESLSFIAIVEATDETANLSELGERFLEAIELARQFVSGHIHGLSATRDLSEVLATTKNFPKALMRAAKKITQVFHADACMIYVLDGESTDDRTRLYRDSRQLTLCAYAGLESNPGQVSYAIITTDQIKEDENLAPDQELRKNKRPGLTVQTFLGKEPMLLLNHKEDIENHEWYRGELSNRAHGDCVENLAAVVLESTTGSQGTDRIGVVRIENKRRDGKIVPINHLDVAQLRHIASVLAISIDNDRNRSRSMTDKTSGIKSRAFLDEMLSRDSTNEYAVIFLDIDKFKSFNDRYGYEGGDAVIGKIGRVLRDSTEEILAKDSGSNELEAFPCRNGGDEFVVIVRCTGDSRKREKAVRSLAQKIRDKSNEVFEIRGSKFNSQEYGIPLSIGIFDPDDDRSEEMRAVQCAAHASRVAKGCGGNLIIDWREIRDLSAIESDVIEIWSDDTIVVKLGSKEGLRKNFLLEIRHRKPAGIEDPTFIRVKAEAVAEAVYDKCSICKVRAAEAPIRIGDVVLLKS